MPANLENSAVATGLEMVSCHFNPKQGQCQRIFKLPHNRIYFTSTCTSWVQKRQRNQRSNCQHLMDHRKNKGVSENIYFCFTDYTKAFDCVDHNKLENSSRDGNTRPPYLPPEKSVYRSGSNS